MLFFIYLFSYEVRSDSRQETREQSRPQTRPVTTPENIRETDERRETDETKYETKYTRGGDRTICICGGNLAGARLTTFMCIPNTVYNERTRTEVRDETTDGGTGEVTTVLGSDEDVEGSL